MPVIPALRKWRQEDQKFKVTIISTACLRLAWVSEKPKQAGEMADRQVCAAAAEDA